MDARKPTKPKYVDRFVDRYGKERFYFRRKGGPRITLEGEPGTEEFAASYKEAKAWDDVPNSKLTGGTKRVIEPDSTPPLIGVYLLILKGRVVYVGSSLNMPNRVADHRRNGRSFDKAFYIATKPIDRFNLERTLIRALQPPQNKAHRAIVADLMIQPTREYAFPNLG